MGNPYFSYDFASQNAAPPNFNFNSIDNGYLELQTSINNINSHFKTIMDYLSREDTSFSSSSSPSPPVSSCNESPDIPACLIPLEEDNYLDIPDCFLPPLEDTSIDIPVCFLPVEDDEMSRISPSEDALSERGFHQLQKLVDSKKIYSCYSTMSIHISSIFVGPTFHLFDILGNMTSSPL
ncbi:hypothetical protein KSP39_PZI023484 [Platanthera zijinensis]|uniref:Uncharacterized protein n=1 Tax=Platanthera zijinensis TaxID=2320716 RepID=A0AAP0ATR0_9ASPA